MSARKLCRRIVFSLALLLTGAVTIACVQYIYQHRPSLQPISSCLWGFDSLGLILAFWVAGRVQSFRRWSYSIRLVVYFLAFGFGGMLFDTTQDWWTGQVPTFQLPGLVYESYGRPLVSILPVLFAALLFLPLFRTFGCALSEHDAPFVRRPISILDLLSWTALAATIFVWIRFLNSDLAPTTSYSYSTVANNFRKQSLSLLLSLIPAAVLLVQLIAWRRHWLCAIGVLIVGWLVDSLLTGFFAQTIRNTTGDSFGVLSTESDLRWYYIGGRSLLGFIFGGLALLFGITIRFSNRVTPLESNDVHTTDVLGESISGIENESVLLTSDLR